MGKEIELKTWPVYFEAIVDGRKSFEIRENDRDFQVGDTLILAEWDPKSESYSGRTAKRKVTYIAKSIFGLPPTKCVMGLAGYKSACGEWVRIEDGLPEESGEYLVQTKDLINNDPIDPCTDFFHSSIDEWETNPNVRRVIAWRKKPEPFTEPLTDLTVNRS